MDDGSTRLATLAHVVGDHQVSRPTLAIYNLYWSTYGGGEQVSGALAEYLSRHFDVTLLGPDRPDVAQTKARLDVDISGCAWRRVVDDSEASEASADFDVFVNGTYRSHSVNRASAGYYYVHFPEPPVEPRRRVVSTVARTGLTVMKAAPRMPERLEGVRRGLTRRVIDTSWSRSYTDFWSNSRYTADWVTRLWDVESRVLHPPVRPSVQPGVKVPVIASIGRFFDPSLGHSKKQLDLVRAFNSMGDSGDWRLVLVGGADGASRDYALAVRREAVGHRVDVHLNAPRHVVEETLAGASIYWHGGGFGEDPERHPERFEHFGIAVVEAMAAGAVPVVFAAAGPAEIVRHGVDGFHWHTIDELQRLTARLVDDTEMRQRMSAAARERAGDFTVARFDEGLGRLIGVS